MADLATMQAQLEDLLKLRAGGARELQHDHRRMVFKSDDELAAAIRDLERRIALTSRSRPVRTVYVNSSRGI